MCRRFYRQFTSQPININLKKTKHKVHSLPVSDTDDFFEDKVKAAIKEAENTKAIGLDKIA